MGVQKNKTQKHKRQMRRQRGGEGGSWLGVFGFGNNEQDSTQKKSWMNTFGLGRLFNTSDKETKEVTDDSKMDNSIKEEEKTKENENEKSQTTGGKRRRKSKRKNRHSKRKHRKSKHKKNINTL